MLEKIAWLSRWKQAEESEMVEIISRKKRMRTAPSAGLEAKQCKNCCAVLKIAHLQGPRLTFSFSHDFSHEPL